MEYAALYAVWILDCFTHFESMRIGFLPNESRITVSAMIFNILLQNTKLLQLN